MRFVSPGGFPAPGLATDAILFKGDEILLVRRGAEPFRGAWALPGGFVEVGETTEAACLRELAEETGLLGEVLDLLGVYDDPARDPRGHTVSVVYVCKVGGVLPGIAEPKAGSDAADARWFPIAALPDLAFDHGRIVADARAWLKAGGEAVLYASE